MEENFIPIDGIEFIDINSLTTTTTTPTTTTTTTTEPIPPPPTCNDCDPPLNNQYVVTFDNLGGIFAAYNTSFIVTNEGGCLWRIVTGEYIISLQRFETNMVVQLYVLGLSGTNDVIWSKVLDECEMVTTLSGFNIAGCRSDADIDACAASANASATISEV